ncbi:type II toxin-antitoxin system PemK/MazF family toxin [Bradyrhizobium sp. STM 3562]|uniref:type II toxin-antitoxin system PemK/MazF family toxin n=1 Tax=Bradyrhizobium sp. STM 3562 TaxID=578924 RepID=UPI00388DE7CB
MIAEYVDKETGDFIWIDLDPRSATNKAVDDRPLYYHRTPTMPQPASACPITSRVRGYPLEAKLGDGTSIRGVVRADQPRSISWEKRPIQHAGRVPDIVLTEVRERLAALLGID